MKKLTKFLIVVILTIMNLIVFKKNVNYKSLFYKYVYSSNISFAQINKWYESKFGSSIPFGDYFVETSPVFNEQIKYSEESIYLDGVKLKVGLNYLVPSLQSGIVIFVGEKENYGNTVIVEQENGIEVWYSNLNEVNVSIYDYIDSNSLIGEVNEYLYLVFMKDGEIINYKECL